MVQELDNAIARPPISIRGRAPSTVLFVAEPLADGAGRQDQRDARRQILADQDSDVGQSNAEVAAEQGCYGGDASKLKAQGEANREQDDKHEPAVAQHLSPLKSPRNLRRDPRVISRVMRVTYLQIGAAYSSRHELRNGLSERSGQ